MDNTEFRIGLERRTLVFAANVIRLVRTMPKGFENRNLRDQVLRSATSIGANYREANRAESGDDFCHKIAIVAKEAAETEYWLLLLKELIPGSAELTTLLVEANNFTRLFDKIRRTMATKKERNKQA